MSDQIASETTIHLESRARGLPRAHSTSPRAHQVMPGFERGRFVWDLAETAYLASLPSGRSPFAEASKRVTR